MSCVFLVESWCWFVKLVFLFGSVAEFEFAQIVRRDCNPKMDWSLRSDTKKHLAEFLLHPAGYRW